MSKRTVLVADPDEEERKRLEEILTPLGIKVVFASAENEVLAHCDSGVDCIVIDAMSAEMKVQELFPKISARSGLPFFVASASGEKDDVVFALKHGCLDWIDKPVDASSVREALKRVASRGGVNLVEDRERSSQQAKGRVLVKEIAKRVRDGKIDLPEVPEIIKELNALLKNLEVESELVCQLIQKDPSLSARLMATVNTATYGGQMWKGRITDLPNCVTRLGNIAVRNLVQTEAMKDMFQFRSPAFKAVFDKMWRAQFISACLAKEVSEASKIGTPDEVYLIGLMHNIGELFLLRVLGEIFQRQNNQILSMDEVLDMVRDYHCIFGEGLVNKWDLGESFAFITRNHHTLEAYHGEEGDEKSDLRQLMHVVNLADQLVLYVGGGYHKKELPAPGLAESYDALEMEADAKERLRNRAQEMFVEVFD